MTDTAVKPQKNVVDAAQFARFLKISPNAVRELASKGQIIKVAPGKYDFLASVQQIICDLRAQVQNGGAAADVVEAKRDADRLLTEAKTRKIELDIAATEGQLVQASEVLVLQAQMSRKSALFLTSLPDTMERQGLIDKFGVDAVRRMCDAQCQKLYDELHQSLQGHELTMPEPLVGASIRRTKATKASKDK